MRCLAYGRVVSLVTNASSGRAGTPNPGGVCPTTLLTSPGSSRDDANGGWSNVSEKRIPADTVHVQVSPRPAQRGSFLYLVGDEPRFAAFRNSPEGASRVGAASLPASTGYRAHEPPDGRPGRFGDPTS